jgi:hypothetical protein
MATSDRATIVDTCAVPETVTHENGWLTAESYLAWVTGSENVCAGDRPFAQPPTLSLDDAVDEEPALDLDLSDMIAA